MCTHTVGSASDDELLESAEDNVLEQLVPYIFTRTLRLVPSLTVPVS